MARYLDIASITIPYVLASNAIATVLDELGPKDNTKWRLVTYKDNTKWFEYPDDFSTLTQGMGYFMNVRTPPTLGFAIDGASSPANNKSSPFIVTLASGWNQIGNPYTFPILWSEVKAANPGATTVGNLKVYKGSYADGDRLEAFEGGFVNNTGAPVQITFPIVGSLTGGRVMSASHDLASENWVVPITLKINGYENAFGGIGMNPKANIGIDNFDDFNPPQFFDFAEMSFAHPEHFMKVSTRDIVPTRSDYTWDFTVQTNLSGPALFNWDNTSFGANLKDLFLHDLKRGVIIDMREVDQYAFDAAKSSVYRIYYGENLKTKVKPQSIMLGEVYPNPSRGTVTIPFTLSPADESYHVQMEFYDSKGSRTGTVIDGTFKPGFYNVNWEFPDSYSNGLFVYRMKVLGNTQSEMMSGKVLLNR